MSKNNFDVKKGIDVRNGRFIADENEVSIDGVAIATHDYVDTADTILQNYIDAVDAKYSDLGLDQLTVAEVAQLQNIDTTTISSTQWGYVGVLDQSLTTTDDVVFNTIDVVDSISIDRSGDAVPIGTVIDISIPNDSNTTSEIIKGTVSSSNSFNGDWINLDSGTGFPNNGFRVTGKGRTYTNEIFSYGSNSNLNLYGGEDSGRVVSNRDFQIAANYTLLYSHGGTPTSSFIDASFNGNLYDGSYNFIQFRNSANSLDGDWLDFENTGSGRGFRVAGNGTTYTNWIYPFTTNNSLTLGGNGSGDVEISQRDLRISNNGTLVFEGSTAYPTPIIDINGYNGSFTAIQGSTAGGSMTGNWIDFTSTAAKGFRVDGDGNVYSNSVRSFTTNNDLSLDPNGTGVVRALSDIEVSAGGLVPDDTSGLTETSIFSDFYNGITIRHNPSSESWPTDTDSLMHNIKLNDDVSSVIYGRDIYTRYEGTVERDTWLDDFLHAGDTNWYSTFSNDIGVSSGYSFNTGTFPGLRGASIKPSASTTSTYWEYIVRWNGGGSGDNDDPLNQYASLNGTLISVQGMGVSGGFSTANITNLGNTINGGVSSNDYVRISGTLSPDGLTYFVIAHKSTDLTNWTPMTNGNTVTIGADVDVSFSFNGATNNFPITYPRITYVYIKADTILNNPLTTTVTEPAETTGWEKIHKDMSYTLNGSGAVAYSFDTVYDLATAGAKIVSFNNYGSEIFSIDKTGAQFGSSTSNAHIISGFSSYTGFGDLLETTYDNVSADLSAQLSTSSRGGTFSTDGIKYFGINGLTNTLYEFDLTIPFDLNTISYNSVSLGLTGTSMETVKFKPDGTEFYYIVNTNSVVYQFTCPTPFSLTGATETTSYTANTEMGSGGTDIAISPDGTKMFLMNNGGDIYQYTLGTPWLVSSATYDTVSWTNPVASTHASVSLNADGTKMYLTDIGFNDGIFEYTLDTPYSVASVTDNEIFFDLSNETTGPYQSDFADSGKRIFVGSLNGDVFSYTMGLTGVDSAVQVTTDAGVSIVASGAIEGAEPWVIVDNMSDDNTDNWYATQNKKYMVDTTNRTSNVTLVMPTPTVVGTTITVCDVKSNFGVGGSKNVVTDAILFEGTAATNYEFDIVNSVVQLVWVDGTFGWKEIIIQG